MVNSKLKSLFVGNSVFIFGGSLLVPIYALFTEDIGATVQMTGLLFAAKFVATALADIVIMRIPHKFNNAVAVYQWSMFVRALAWLYIGVAPSITSLLIVQIVTGLAEGFGTPAFSTLMTNALDKKRQMQQWALWDLIKNPVLAASGIAGGFIANQYGFSVLFYAMGILALAGTLVPVGNKGLKRRKAKQYAKLSYEYLFSR
nr:Major Facilitator Superfamily [uncultured bacterium]AIA14717.1 Major Facilitator Superfamily [uncultured bacterium]